MATNAVAGEANNWEVVDGLQRVTTLVGFAGSETARSQIGLTTPPLRLRELEKLTTFDGASFLSLPDDLRSLFEDRPLKVVVLNDKSDVRVRFDLFERINTGGIRLTDQEVRDVVFRGEFIDLLDTLADRDDFKTVVLLPTSSQHDGTAQEYVLRFFAYVDGYEDFGHLVKKFLDEYTIAARDGPDHARRTQLFDKTFNYLAECFPDGIRGKKGTTPVNLYEGLSVGAALALRHKSSLQVPADLSWVTGDELKQFISGATNTRVRVRGRIEYCRDKFLGR